MKKVGENVYLADDGEVYEIIGITGNMVLLGRQVDFFRDVIQLFATTKERIDGAEEVNSEDLPDKPVQS